MSLTLSQVTIPYWVRTLNALSAILDKAEAYAEAKKIDPGVLLNARLAPDMRPLTFQVQVASDMVKLCVGRLAGVTPPSFPDDEKTFEDLCARIKKTIDYIQSVPAEAIDAGEGRTIELKLRGNPVVFSARDYVFGFVTPNFHFHAATLYGILRHNGLHLAKGDFLGAP